MTEPSNDLLRPNQTFDTVAGRCRIKRMLGSGLTSEVYEAELPDGTRVAVKAMRPNASAQGKNEFIQEGPILAKMNEIRNEAKPLYYENEKRDWRSYANVAPIYYGGDRDASPPYIVEELMSGILLPDLLEKAGGKLEEAVALDIAIQLFGVIHLLHHERGKTYIDLKFPNLWWDSNKRALKITDWGTVEDLTDSGVTRDVLRCALYLYRCLSGIPITELNGVLSSDPDSHDEWKNISWGLQEILLRLLNPYPALRKGDSDFKFQSAYQVAKALNGIKEGWDKKLNELWDEVQTELEDAQGEDKPGSKYLLYHRAKTRLDIAQRQTHSLTQKQESLAKEINDGLRDINHFSRGQALYNGGSYGHAKTLFTQGAWLYRSAELRRWAIAARAGELSGDQYKLIKKDVGDGLIALSANDYANAANAFERAYQTSSVPPLKELRDESEMFDLIEHAQRERLNDNYGDAATAYLKAFNLFRQLDTEWQQHWHYEVGDLETPAAEMRQLRDSKGVAEKAIAAAEDITEKVITPPLDYIVDKDIIGKILKLLQDAVKAQRGEDGLFERIQTIAQKMFDAGRVEDAIQILRVGGEAPNPAPRAYDWRVPAEIADALLVRRATALSLPLSLKFSDERRVAVEIDDALARRLTALNPLPSLDFSIGRVRSDLVRAICYTKLQTHFEMALDADNAERAESLYRIAQRINPEGVNGWYQQIEYKKGKLVERHRDKIKDIYADAEKLLNEKLGRDLLDKEQMQQRVDDVGLAREKLNALKTSTEQADLIQSIEESLHRADRLIHEITNYRQSRQEKTMKDIDYCKNELTALKAEFEKATGYLNSASAPEYLKQQFRLYRIELLAKSQTLLRALKENAQALEGIAPEQRTAEQKKQIADLKEWMPNHDKWVDEQFTALGERDQLLQLAKGLSEPSSKPLAKYIYEAAEAAYSRGDASEAKALSEKIAGEYAGDEKFSSLVLNIDHALAKALWEAENFSALKETPTSKKPPKFDPEILQHIGGDLAHKLPQVYWKDSPSLSYLISVEKKLKGNIDAISDEDKLAERLRQLVWVNNLERRAEGKPVTEKKWDGKDLSRFTNSVRGARGKKNFETQVDVALNNISLFENPENESQRLTMGMLKEPGKPQPQWSPLNIALGALAVILLLVAIVGGGLIFGPMISPPPSPVPTVTLIPTAPSTPVPATIAPATNTPTPTATATKIQATSTQTPTSTVAGLAPIQLANVKPEIKVANATIGYELDYKEANNTVSANPPLDYTKGETANWRLPANSPLYCGGVETGSPNFISIDLDKLPATGITQPISWTVTTKTSIKPGVYAIFVSDTAQCSAGEAKYEVKGEKRITVFEDKTRGTATFKPSPAKDWISLGTYLVPEEEKISITMSSVAGKTKFLALDRVLIIPLPNPVDKLAEKEKGQIFIFDDRDALDIITNQPIQQSPINPNSLGSHYINYPPLTPTPVAEQPTATVTTGNPVTLWWDVTNVLSPGDYYVYVLYLNKNIANPTVTIEFQETVTGSQPVSFKVARDDDNGGWFKADKEVKFTGAKTILRAKVDVSSGIDAIAFVKK